MAEIATSNHGNHRAGQVVQKVKKLSTRIDLTPMVDLGFLLITFFIFTTTMSTPSAMKLILPADTPSRMPVKESGALTLILGNNDLIYFYEGIFKTGKPSLAIISFSRLRDLLINKKSTTDPDKLMIVIKPHKESIFKNTVDALDEMKINDLTHYALVDISPEETVMVDAMAGSH